MRKPPHHERPATAPLTSAAAPSTLFELPSTTASRPAARRPAPVHVERTWYADIDRVTYLGSPDPSWLARPEFGEDCIPLCVSHHRLDDRRSLPRAVTPWMLDSGGFTTLSERGRWTVTPYAYAAAARRYYDEIGLMDACAIQDWMVEAKVLARTGLTVWDHQLKTVASFLNLMTLDAELPWMPVLQGFTLDEYLRCVDLYGQAGVNLTLEPVVGIGSVCRRQGTKEAVRIIETLASMGIRLHGFGFKVTGLRNGACHLLYSSDSMAWSKNAMYREPMPGCTHQSCSSCPRYARAWRNQMLNSLPEDRQLLTLTA
ncbi:deazapurine DNA modification protein DpdA family protein [Streptomyces parvus]|uniref:deazapurine DNA modification protein DpdA family protein n=1 Tax=Streptomyces parvus TaxID=66428 RepID=UPI003717ADE6